MREFWPAPAACSGWRLIGSDVGVSVMVVALIEAPRLVRHRPSPADRYAAPWARFQGARSDAHQEYSRGVNKYFRIWITILLLFQPAATPRAGTEIITRGRLGRPRTLAMVACTAWRELRQINSGAAS